MTRTITTLSHFSRHATIKPYSAKQGVGRCRTDKPNGLWVSVDGDDDWPSWCRSEAYGDIDAANRFVVTVATGAKILTLGSVAEIDEFHATYAPGKFGHGVDWEAVARDYQGIIIAPYQWARRLNGAASDWYYSWDCASGCIWDASAIAEVRRLAEAVAS